MNTRSTPATVGWRSVVWGSRVALVSPLLWPTLWRHLFDSAYMPQGESYGWTGSLVWLHVASDFLIALSFVSISISLIYLLHRARRALPFGWIVAAFGVFLIACGATHFMEVWTIWRPMYWLSGAIKIVTAISSLLTACAMPIVISGVLRLIADARISRERQQNLGRAYELIRETDEVLRREHRYMSALLDGLQEQVVVTDTEGRVIFSNERDSADHPRRARTAAQIFDELELRNPETNRPLQRDERPLARALRGQTVRDMAVQFRWGGGDWRFGLATTQPVVDEDGSPIGVMGVLRDVTQERQAGRLIDDLQQRNTAILNAAGEGICGVDVQGHTILMNPAAEEISGWGLTALQGHLRHDLLHHTRSDGTPYPWHECPVYLTLQDGRQRRITDDIFWRPDGTWFPVEFFVSALRDDKAVVGAVITFQDISETRRLELDLEQSRRVESLGRLAATIAHEFNNVLMGIQPFVEVIGARVPNDPDLRKALNFISLGVQRGKRVSQDILRFTQPAEPALETIDVHAWAAELVGQATPMLGPRTELQVDLSFDVEGMLGDASQLHQVFLNLLLNARDAMPDGGTIRFIARCSSENATFPFGTVPEPAKFVHFTVTDTGPGIAPDVMQHLFEPLFTTKKTGGTGLGLALVRQVVTRHGGHVFAESKLGGGAAFHVFLTSADTPSSMSSIETRRGALTGWKILLVEDEQAVAAGIEILMEMEGITAQTVSRGAEAVPAIESFQPDAVVLDIGLPDMPGEEVYQEIARRWPALPVVFSTGHADPTTLRSHLTKPNVAFLTKPYEARDLLLLLEKLVVANSTDP